jgi:hypothetical protein
MEAVLGLSWRVRFPVEFPVRRQVMLLEAKLLEKV